MSKYRPKPQPTSTTSTTTTTEPPPTTTEEPTTTEATTTEAPTTTVDPTTTEASTVDPQCAEGWYPASYDPDAECLPFDPCSGDGVTTLWTIQPCPATGASSEVGMPSSEVGMPMLPATGAELTLAGAGFGVLLAGLIAVWIARRTVSS